MIFLKLVLQRLAFNLKAFCRLGNIAVAGYYGIFYNQSLNSGKILLEGDSQTIANSPIAKKFYLGDNFTL